jgi:hypothetical protein
MDVCVRGACGAYSLDSVVALLEFLYTDNLAQPLGPLSPGLSRLVIAAEKYDVPKLAALCRCGPGPRVVPG